MYTKTKLFRITIMLSAALFLSLAAAPLSLENTQASNGTTVTKILVHGRGATVLLVDSGADTTGFLNASEDQTTQTKSLDFSYGSLDPTDPNLLIILQGAGEIPNTALTFTSTSAHLALTTPDSYFVNRCVVNTDTGEFACAPGGPLTFDLTWVTSSIGSVWEKKKRVETFGPFTTKFQGEFTILTATVSGTGESGEISATNLPGDFTNTANKTFIREITMKTSP